MIIVLFIIIINTIIELYRGKSPITDPVLMPIPSRISVTTKILRSKDITLPMHAT